MDEDLIRWEHGLASLRCLRAAFNVLSPVSAQSVRQLQVIRGVWAFLPYATEFWAVDLSELISTSMDRWDRRSLSVAGDLSVVLETSLPGPENICLEKTYEEIGSIRQRFPGLWHDATLSLHGRSSGKSHLVGRDSAGKFQPAADRSCDEIRLALVY
jgi:hypothetical protein